jgi:hypothetical protein
MDIYLRFCDGRFAQPFIQENEQPKRASHGAVFVVLLDKF